jgi:hypothetical protein
MTFAAYGVLALWVAQIFVLYSGGGGDVRRHRMGRRECAVVLDAEPHVRPDRSLRGLALGVLRYPMVVLLATYGTLLFQLTLAPLTPGAGGVST